MARVLVTGGAGYIGSHACKALAEAGFEPIVFDNLSMGHRSFCRWGALVPGDVRSRDDLERAFEAFRPDAVMHFAAQSIVPRSVAEPDETFDVNVSGTLALLRAMRRFDVEHLVFSSTCAVYGETDGTPLCEDLPLAPISPYGASKAHVERMLSDFDDAYGTKSIRLRYFNAAGADPEGMVGEWHEPETHIIPIVLDVALGLRASLSLYGSDYATPDGTAVRDYIHVDDLARAHVAALKHLRRGGSSVALNVGTGAPVSVAELVQHVEACTGRRVPVREMARRPGDSARLVADARQAQRVLNWKANYSIRQIIEHAWNWHSLLRQDVLEIA